MKKKLNIVRGWVWPGLIFLLVGVVLATLGTDWPWLLAATGISPLVVYPVGFALAWRFRRSRVAAILLGLFDSRAPAAGKAARRVKRIGYGRADSMALILIAKHTDRLSEKELQDLGVIASGGRVSAVLQAQAGWLYLKHAGRLEHTLAVIFADP